MSVKTGHFSHVFHMVFHIHTPSSVQLPLIHYCKGTWKDKLMHAMVLFSSFLPFDALQIHYIVPIKHSVEQLGMALLQAFFLPPPLLCLF